MKSYIALMFLCGANALLQEPCNDDGEKGIFDVNKIVDAVINQVRKVLVRDGYDPLDLPPYEVALLHLGVLGKLQLYDCKLYNLSTVYRSKGIESEKINKTINIQAAVAFDKLKVPVNCTYKASLLTILNKKGKAVVTIPSLSANTDLDFYLSTLKVHLKDLQLHNDGPIDVHLEGGILDSVLSILTEAISNLFQFSIINYVESVMEDELRRILEGSSVKLDVAGEQMRISS